MLLAVIGAVALTALFAVAGISDRASGGAHEEGIDESAMGRIYAWGAAFRMAVDHPVSGVGLNNFLANYWAYSAQFVHRWDVFTGLAKSVFFGLAIALISCYKGFHCDRGAQGVGKATTSAFVASFVTIIILNFFLAKFANDLYRLLYGSEPALLG